MRTPSQDLANLLTACKYEEAIKLLNEHGIEKTKILLWLSTHTGVKSPGLSALLNAVNSFEISGDLWTDALLRRVANDFSKTEEDTITDLMIDKSDPKIMQERLVMHHLAYHGNETKINPIKEKLDAAGVWAGWDHEVEKMGTPLFLAIREENVEAALVLMKNGASGDFILKKMGSVGGQENVSAAKAAIFMAGKRGSSVEASYKLAKNRAALESVAESVRGMGKVVEKGIKRIITRM